VKVGRHTYGHELLTVRRWRETTELTIGSFCSIADRCVVLLGGNHRSDWVTTFPFPALLDAWPQAWDRPVPTTTGGDVVIGNDVWIGSNVTIMSGVTVRDGAVLAANSCVTKSVPPYAIVGGNPGRVLRYRFNERQIAALLEIRWWDWSDDRISEHIGLLCDRDVDAFIAATLPAFAAAGSLPPMGDGSAGLRRRVRQVGGRAAKAAALRGGFELVRAGVQPTSPATPSPESLPGDAYEVIPRGRTERFQTAEYDVLPKGLYDIVPHNYYSPVPDLSLLPPDIFERRSALGGVELGVDAAIELVETELAPYVAEMEVPLDGPRPAGEFFLNNTNYESVDAELLYALIRARKPRRVMELGSGFTTLLIGAAARRNAGDGSPTEHVAYDPYPRRQIIGDVLRPPTQFEPVSATDVPLETFASLEDGDILFVDTTHTVKLGSDVNFIVLDVLPVLPPGVIVHFHDIFLPWEYPRVWFEQMNYLWAEQYLLQAFLAYNSAFEVLLPAQAVARKHPERLGAAIPSFGPGRSPGAIWLRRRA
jgi:acetyltransferase-like isoleucine patch superfamily enzyme